MSLEYSTLLDELIGLSKDIEEGYSNSTQHQTSKYNRETTTEMR